ncbi:MAG: hypothetical protein N2V75_00895 [Methanophagales archaeon]|nr:hypothetical protein [Methanophagales archaeon]
MEVGKGRIATLRASHYPQSVIGNCGQAKEVSGDIQRGKATAKLMGENFSHRRYSLCISGANRGSLAGRNMALF